MLLAAEEQPWNWKDSGRNVRTREELTSIVEAHRTWVRSQTLQGRRADLTDANLMYANLSGAELTDAVLTTVDLSLAKLSGAHLGWAKLNRAKLNGAELRQVDLSNADLTGADLTAALLTGADLSGADLRSANLSGAYFSEANLSGANFTVADLSGANFTGADLRGAQYEPAKQPDPHAIAGARGLDYLTWSFSAAPIYVLRKSLIDAEFRYAARQLTAAIRRHNQKPFERVFFDWTCEWGANWLRPLELVGALSLICTLVYWVGMHFGKRSGLYLAATGQRITTVKGKEHVLRLHGQHPRPATPSNQLELGLPQLRPTAPPVSWRRKLRLEMRDLGTAFLFSLMSVFNIGFREFNFGRWLRMLQPRDFDIRARGWMRTVSGVQSLIGVTLVALSILSYFGHPFD